MLRGVPGRRIVIQRLVVESTSYTPSTSYQAVYGFGKACCDDSWFTIELVCSINGDYAYKYVRTVVIRSALFIISQVN